MTAWASWQFREFVFHVTKNANTASREEGQLYRSAVRRVLAHRRRQVRHHLFCLTEGFNSHTLRLTSPEVQNNYAQNCFLSYLRNILNKGVLRPGKATHTQSHSHKLSAAAGVHREQHRNKEADLGHQSCFSVVAAQW